MKRLQTAPKDIDLRILNYIRIYRQKNKFPPAIRDIMKKLGISSTSVVNYRLDALVRMGYFSKAKRVARSLNLTKKGVLLVGKAQ